MVHRCGSSASARRSVSRMIRYSSETVRSSSSTRRHHAGLLVLDALVHEQGGVAAVVEDHVRADDLARLVAELEQLLGGPPVLLQGLALPGEARARPAAPPAVPCGPTTTAAAAWSWVEKMLQDDPAHLGAEADRASRSARRSARSCAASRRRARRAAAGPRRTRGAAPSGRASRARPAGSPCGRTRRAPRSATAKSMPLRVLQRRPAVSGAACRNDGHGVKASSAGPLRARTDVPDSGALGGTAAGCGGHGAAGRLICVRGDATRRPPRISEAPFVPVTPRPSVADRSVPRAAPLERRPTPITRSRHRGPAVDPSGSRAAAGQPMRPGSAQQVVAQQRLGAASTCRRRRAARRGRPRSRRRPRTAHRRQQPAASSGSALQRRRPPPPAAPRVALPEHPAGEHHQADVPAGRPRPRAPRGAGARRRTAASAAIRRSSAALPGPGARSRPRWSSARTVGPSRSASTGSTTPSAWPSTSTPAAAARTPRSPSTVRRATRRRRSARVDVGGRAADVDDQHPHARSIRASSAAARGHGVRGAPPAPAAGTAAPTAGPRPPSTCRAYSSATRRPGRAPARSRPAAARRWRRPARCARWRAAAPPRRRGPPRCRRARSGSGSRARASRPALCSSAGGVVAVRAADQQHHAGPCCCAASARRRAPAGRRARAPRARRPSTPPGAPPLSAVSRSAPTDRQPQPAAGRRAGQQLGLGVGSRSRRDDGPHRRVHAGQHVRGGGRVLGEPGQRAVRT